MVFPSTAKPTQLSAVHACWRHRLGRALAGLLGVLAAACAPTPERLGAPAVWLPSPNFNERRPSYVVLHHTSNDTVDRALRTLTDPVREVSAHYVVGRDGKVFQLVDERYRAWHAGRSQWGADFDLNSSSIGIELDNSGDEPFPQAQIEALLRLLAGIRERYRIPAPNFLGHADVSPGRKVDPSAWFPWRLLAQYGFGMWCDPPFAPAPATFDPMLGLAVLGYDTRNAAAAIHAYKLRFVQNDSTPALTQEDSDRLYCLLARRAQALP
jgi:N-acetylmuramoyl-L-alanine amidase